MITPKIPLEQHLAENYAGTLPFIGRVVGAVGAAYQGLEFIGHKIQMRDGSAYEKETLKRLKGASGVAARSVEKDGEWVPLAASNDPLDEYRKIQYRTHKETTLNKQWQKVTDCLKRAIPLYGLAHSFTCLEEARAPFMWGIAGKLDYLCAVPVIQQMIGVPRLAYHVLLLIVNSALRATGSALNYLFVDRQEPGPKGQWLQTHNRELKAKVSLLLPKTTRDFYRCIPVVGSIFSVVYINATKTQRSAVRAYDLFESLDDDLRTNL